MKSLVSLPQYIQKPSTDSSPEPVKSNSRPHTLFMRGLFSKLSCNLYLILRVCLLPQYFPTKNLKCFSRMFRIIYMFRLSYHSEFKRSFIKGRNMQIVKLVVMQYCIVLRNGINFLMDYR